MRRTWHLIAGSTACVLLSAGLGPVLGQEVPLSVVYGPAASTIEGDDDYRELLFFSVAADLQERLYLRVFDPDTGGDHDLAYGGSEDTETRYAVFGGPGARTGIASSIDLTEEQLTSGELLAETSIASNAALDGKWRTIATFLPD
jgi:hypothetical protein